MDVGRILGNCCSTGAKVRQQADYISDIVASRGEYDDIVDEYRLFRELWYALAKKLRPLDNRYVERGLRRISSTDKTLHELLWVAHTAERGDLLDLTTTLMRNVDEFFSRTPLKLVLRLDDANHAINTADEFYGVCQNFVDCVERNETDEELRQCYSYVEEAAESFQQTFRLLRSNAAQIALHEIEDGVIALRNQTHYSSSGYDRRRAVELAASLENLADHLQVDVREWLGRKREPFRDEALRETSRFADRAHRLHAALSYRTPRQQIAAEAHDLFETWRTLYYEYLRKCDTDERSHLASLAFSITSDLTDLRTQLDM